MDCRVVVEAGVPVYDVETTDEAVRIAISKTGKMINPDLNYVEIDVAERTAPGSEEEDPAFVVAGAALVALTFEMDVFNVDREEHASRIAHTEIGDRLVDIPLEVVAVEELDEEDANRADRATEDDGERTARATASGDADRSPSVEDEATTEADEESDAEVLPSFEELLEE